MAGDPWCVRHGHFPCNCAMTRAAYMCGPCQFSGENLCTHGFVPRPEDEIADLRRRIEALEGRLARAVVIEPPPGGYIDDDSDLPEPIV